MNKTYQAARVVAGIQVLVVVAVAGRQALAEEKSWVPRERTLPVPAAASDALRASIAKAPQPNVAAHIQVTTFKTNEEQVKCIRAAGDPSKAAAKALAERRKVTIKEEKIESVDYVLVTYEGVLAGAAKLYAGNHAMTDSLRVTPEGRIMVSLPQLPATEELESINTNVLLMLRVIAHMKRPC